MGHSLEEGEAEGDQLQVGLEGEAEVAAEVDHHRGEGVAAGAAAVLPCCPAREEEEAEAEEVLIGLAGEEEEEVEAAEQRAPLLTSDFVQLCPS